MRVRKSRSINRRVQAKELVLPFRGQAEAIVPAFGPAAGPAASLEAVLAVTLIPLFSAVMDLRI